MCVDMFAHMPRPSPLNACASKQPPLHTTNTRAHKLPPLTMLRKTGQQSAVTPNSVDHHSRIAACFVPTAVAVCGMHDFLTHRDRLKRIGPPVDTARLACM